MQRIEDYRESNTTTMPSKANGLNGMENKSIWHKFVIFKWYFLLLIVMMNWRISHTNNFVLLLIFVWPAPSPRTTSRCRRVCSSFTSFRCPFSFFRRLPATLSSLDANRITAALWQSMPHHRQCVEIICSQVISLGRHKEPKWDCSRTISHRIHIING